MELTRRLFWLQLAAKQRVITAAGSDCVCVRHALRLPRASTAHGSGRGLLHVHICTPYVAYRHLGWPPAD